MAKSKTKRGAADKVRHKKAEAKQTTNPFEVKINRQKHVILGKQLTCYDKGKPGISRSRAIQKRKNTLLQEYKRRGKTNKMVDRRVGETDLEMSLEDKMLQRFTMERQRVHEKSGLYNLKEEEEQLTHFGQSLSEIEKFEDPRNSDDDEEDTGAVSGEIVAREHFGGFMTRRNFNDDENEGSKKTWKERMEEIITKSKKHKYERLTEKEQNLELTETVDLEWKQLRMAMASNKGTASDQQEKPKSDDYDIMVRQLQFDIKGKATDRLKTDEELATNEKEKLEALEMDRLRRMKGISEKQYEQTRQTYRSADDLDDDFAVDKKSNFEVMYKDGVLVSEGVDSDDKDGGSADETSDQSEAEEEAENSEEDDDEEEEDEDSDTSNPMQHLSDLEEEDEEEDMEDEEEDMEEDMEENNQPKQDKPSPHKVSKLKSKLLSSDQTELSEENKQQKAKMIADAKKELPYTFPAPNTYEDLLKLLSGHTEQNQITILERLQKLYHPSLAEGNKQKLQNLYSLLVEYYCDQALQDPPALGMLERLLTPLYDLTQQFPIPAAQAWANLLQEQHHDFSEAASRKGGRGCFPKLDVLMTFRAVSLLYPTSDFRHLTVTPAMLFMGQILSQSPVQTRQDIASGLFLCAQIYEYVAFAKRLVPEVINYLQGLLFLAIEKSPNQIESVCPPFKPVGKNVDLLKLDEKYSSAATEKMNIPAVLGAEPNNTYLNSEEFRVCAVHQAMLLTGRFSALYKHLPAWSELFSPVLRILRKFPTAKYPDNIQKLHGDLLQDLDPHDSLAKKFLVRQKDRPKPIKMFEPKFEANFECKKTHGGSKEFQEKQRLSHKLKKETKDTVRLLRQDNQFLAREKIKEQAERDVERKEKVKRLYAELATQEGDFRAMKRNKPNKAT